MEHFPLVDRLHTDVLEEKYGPIHAVVLVHNEKMRLAHLADVKDVSRTFAITFFSASWTSDVRRIDKDIRKGTPIGKAFRKKEYAIRKNVLEVYTLQIPPWLKTAFDTRAMRAKARLSEFYAKKRGQPPVMYGVVIEIYSPDFRTATINKVDRAQESALTQELEKQGFTKEEIWRRIGRENDYEDQKKAFAVAKKESITAKAKFKRKIAALLKRQNEAHP
ncbi:MAG: hypothetical protein V1725_02115 [archaeon]